MPLFQNLVGQKFGLLTVEKLAQKKGNVTIWICRCECGKIKQIRAQHLRSGATKSCGCFQKTPENNPNHRHGKRYYPEYWPWQAMKDRCTNKNRIDFPSYGGRGITVCDRWRDSFEAFFADMGPRPSPRHSIDRIDNDKGYSPENCRWATNKEQSRNKGLRRGNNSGVSGVGKYRNRWVASIGVDGKHINLGSYITKHNAIASRWVAEAIYWRNQTGE